VERSGGGAVGAAVLLPRERSRNVSGGDGGARAPAREEEENRSDRGFCRRLAYSAARLRDGESKLNQSDPGVRRGDRRAMQQQQRRGLACPISVHTAQFEMLRWLSVVRQECPHIH
jgi:hypothetical protein